MPAYPPPSLGKKGSPVLLNISVNSPLIASLSIPAVITTVLKLAFIHISFFILHYICVYLLTFYIQEELSSR